jgi:putative DNA primase/helicase
MDQDGPSLKLYLANIGYDCEVRILEESVTCMAHANPHHPVRNYLRSLEWDGKRRVEDWLHTYCGVTSNAYTQMVGLKTLIAAVARVMEVGCKFDYMLILEGPQGTGKSSVVSALAGRWFTDSMPMDLSSKDAPEYMRGKWIIEMAELACTTKAETSTLKAFLSRSTDRARMAYARHAKDFPRQCIFIGTTNEQTYLKDETGNRRFWPVKTGKMNVAKLREDRDQIWAEALLLYETCDVKLYLEGEQVATMAKVEQQGRQLLDEWCEELATYIQRDPEIRKTGYVRSAYLWVNCFGRPVGAFDRLSQRRISDAMAVIGWRRQSIRDAEKNVVMAYVPPDNWDWTLRGKEAVLMKEAANILDL